MALLESVRDTGRANAEIAREAAAALKDAHGATTEALRAVAGLTTAVSEAVTALRAAAQAGHDLERVRERLLEQSGRLKDLEEAAKASTVQKGDLVWRAAAYVLTVVAGIVITALVMTLFKGG